MKIFWILMLLVCAASASTNYVYYVKESGLPLNVSDTFSYSLANDSITMGHKTFGGINWPSVGIIRTEKDIPEDFNNIAQVHPYEYILDRDEAISEAISKANIQAAAESNLVALAKAYNVKADPIDWLALYAFGEQLTAQAKAVQATNALAGYALRLEAIELKQTVDAQYGFYRDNGGDPRKAGKKK